MTRAARFFFNELRNMFDPAGSTCDQCGRCLVHEHEWADITMTGFVMGCSNVGGTVVGL